MKYDNYFVADLIISSYYFGDIEKYFLLENRICEKTDKGYIDLVTSAFYSEEQTQGIDRIDADTIVPLNNYFNRFGFKCKNYYDNKKIVYEKVKSLKSQQKI